MADVFSGVCQISSSTCSLLYLRIKLKRKFLTNKKRSVEIWKVFFFFVNESTTIIIVTLQLW